jgi:winged helix domain-containing protein
VPHASGGHAMTATNSEPRKPFIRAQIGNGHGAVEKTLYGRFACTLAKLIEAGEKGIGSIDNVGPRLSHYVWVLRHREGIAIESCDELDGGPFAGRHSRYRLCSPVAILDQGGSA